MARYSNPIIQYSDGNGVPLPGATLDFFEPGTTTPKNTYSDSGLTTPNPNPVEADSAGVMPDIWLDGTYKVVLKNAEGVVQPEGTKDPIGETTEGQWEAWLNDNTYNIPDLVKGSDDKFYRSLTDANQGNDPTSSVSNWENIEFERIYNATVTYALGDRSIGSDGMEYFSLIASNLNNNPVTQTASTNWRAVDQDRSADAGGTVDIITATYIPAVAALKDGLMLRLRSSGPNTSTTPTFSPNGLAASDIVKGGNQALSEGDTGEEGNELILVRNDTNSNWELLNPVASAGAGLTTDNLFHIQDQKTAGTNGGTFTSGAWQQRDLNTEITNTITGASLATNSITLPAGDYFVEAVLPANNVNRVSARLFNSSDTAVVISGTSQYANSSSTGMLPTFVDGSFTIASTKVFELQHRCQTSRASDGFGLSVNVDVPVPFELYSDIKIWKVG